MTRRRWLIAGAVALVAALALGCSHLTRWPSTGAVYVAKQMCSCLFLTGRTEQSCRTDFGDYMKLYTVRIDRADLPRSARVTTALAGFRGEAVYEEGYGCRIAR